MYYPPTEVADPDDMQGAKQELEAERSRSRRRHRTQITNHTRNKNGSIRNADSDVVCKQVGHIQALLAKSQKLFNAYQVDHLNMRMPNILKNFV